MRKLTRLGTCTLAITVAISPVTPFGIVRAAAEGTTRVPLQSDLRRCDFSLAATALTVARPRLGSGAAVIHVAGVEGDRGGAAATKPNPGTHFDVGLIQEPRPSSATCGPGDPGTAFAGMDTDGAGNGTVTIARHPSPRARRASGCLSSARTLFSQNPAEFYTSGFLVPVKFLTRCRAVFHPAFRL